MQPGGHEPDSTAPQLEGKGHRRRRHRSSGQRQSPNLGRSAGDIARLLLLGLITLAPWLMVVLRPSTEFWAIGVSTVCLVFWAVSLLGPQSRFEAPLAVLPLVAAMAMAVFQLIPWPDSLYPWASPGGVAIESRLAAAGETSTEAEGEYGPWSTTITLYPAGTRRELSLLVLAASVFLVSARFLNHERNLFWLCMLLAINGAALAFFGLVQKLTWNGKLFWAIPIDQMAQPFSTFINRNNAAGFLNMTLAGAVGLLYWSMERAGRAPGVIHDEGDSALVRRLLGWWERARWRISRIDGYQIGALALAGTTIAGILYSHSRGAFVALVAAALVTMLTAMIAERRFSGTAVFGIVFLTAVGLLAWIRGGEGVTSRLTTLADPTTSEGRLPIWRDALACASDFRTFGAGLGSYRYAYNLYQERPDPAWHLHAENQYVEALVDGGIPGLALLFLSLGFVIWSMVSLFRHTRDPAQRGLLLMGVFAVTSQVVGAVTDFGLYLPANMLLFAAICGSLVGQATQGIRAREKPNDSGAPRWWLSAGAFLPLLMLASLWGLRENWRIWNVAAAAEQPAAENEKENLDEEDRQALVLDRIERLKTALESRPDDLEGQLALFDLHVAQYRSRAAGWFEPLVGKQESPDLIFLHAWVHHLKRTGQEQALAALSNPAAADGVSDPALAEWARQDVARGCLAPALERLRLAQAACPLDARANLGLAKLVWLDNGWNQEEAWLARTRIVAPADGNLFAETGLLEQNLGNTDAMWRDWRKALGQGTHFEPMILAYAIGRLSPSDIVERVLPSSPEYLVYAASTTFAQKGQEATASLITFKAKELLEQDTELPRSKVFYLRAKLHGLDREPALAIKAYERALKLEPHRVPWREEFARLLFKQDELERALDEARRCVRDGVATPELLGFIKEINDARARLKAQKSEPRQSPPP